jgi:hypothetical protein
MGIEHRIARLEKTAPAAAACRSCGAGDADPTRTMRVVFAEDPEAHALGAAGMLPEDFCVACGRRKVLRIVFDDQG